MVISGVGCRWFAYAPLAEFLLIVVYDNSVRMDWSNRLLFVTDRYFDHHVHYATAHPVDGTTKGIIFGFSVHL